MSILGGIGALIRDNREQLVVTWRERVRQLPSARHLDVPTLNDHIPLFIDELVAAFEKVGDERVADQLADGTAPEHGEQRLQDGFNIVEVVAEYNILRRCIFDLVEAHGVVFDGRAPRLLNLVIDSAIGLAVEAYSSQRALEVQQRREEYLGFVAHDLRTPINAISLTARILEQLSRAPGGDPKSISPIKTLQRNVRQLEGLVAKVLEENTNLQTETGLKLERRTFDLWPLVESLVHDLHPVAGTGSTVLINEVPDDLTVFADASLIRRVFQNLIANAIVYTPRGEVRVGALMREVGGAVECWVSDNGSGIGGDLLDKVFDKGQGDPDRPDSAGLGLAIVKTFVEAHEGQVRATSKPGVGTTIWFTLPPQTPAVANL